jgi:hypothetical protein
MNLNDLNLNENSVIMPRKNSLHSEDSDSLELPNSLREKIS